MVTRDADLLRALETHSEVELRNLLNAGLDPLAPLRGKTPIEWLVEMYLRSDRFPACLRLLLDRGAVLTDPKLTSVLLNDAEALRHELHADSSLLEHRVSMASTFTPLNDATLLHVAAEYGHLAALDVLLEFGAEVDARAGVDERGLGRQTALFHTVNSNANRSAPLMQRLLDAGARADVRIDGLVWGKGFDWETVLFDLTPIAYAQFGLLPQMQRNEQDIWDNVRALLDHAKRKARIENVPNRYLASS